MTDNISNRGVSRDGNFTSLSSFQYQDIKEGTAELTGFTQAGGVTMPVTAVTFAAIRGKGYTISAPSIVDTDETGYFVGILTNPPAAVRSFDLSFVVSFSNAGSLNLPSPTATIEIPTSATGFAGATINSATMLVNGVTRNTMTVHALIEIWGSTDANIYTLLAALLGSDPLPRLNFMVKIAKS